MKIVKLLITWVEKGTVPNTVWGLCGCIAFCLVHPVHLRFYCIPVTVLLN